MSRRTVFSFVENSPTKLKWLKRVAWAALAAASIYLFEPVRMIVFGLAFLMAFFLGVALIAQLFDDDRPEWLKWLLMFGILSLISYDIWTAGWDSKTLDFLSSLGGGGSATCAVGAPSC